MLSTFPSAAALVPVVSAAAVSVVVSVLVSDACVAAGVPDEVLVPHAARLAVINVESNTAANFFILFFLPYSPVCSVGAPSAPVPEKFQVVKDIIRIRSFIGQLCFDTCNVTPIISNFKCFLSKFHRKILTAKIFSSIVNVSNAAFKGFYSFFVSLPIFLPFLYLSINDAKSIL